MSEILTAVGGLTPHLKLVPVGVKITATECLNMLEDFIVPCFAAVVLPNRMLIVDNAPSHKAKKALEWYQTMLHEAGWALFSCQDTRHTHKPL